MREKNYCRIDLLKFIGSLMIFTMHCELFAGSALHLAIQIATRWAVPFFFIASSFFLFGGAKGGKISKERLVRYVKRVLLLYIAWFIVNLPSIFITNIYLKGMFSPYTYINFFKGAVLSSAYKGSWYLTSSVFSAILVYLLGKKLSGRAVVLCTAPLFIICAFSSVYRGFLPPFADTLLVKQLIFPLNLFGGCFYFALGRLLAEHRESLERLSALKIVILLILSYSGFIAEVLLSRRFHYGKATDVGFCIAAVAVCVFLLGIKGKRAIPHHITLRKISTIVFCAQANVLLAMSAFGKSFHIKNSLILYAVALAVMAAVVAVVLLLQTKTKLKFAKYLT